MKDVIVSSFSKRSPVPNMFPVVTGERIRNVVDVQWVIKMADVTHNK